MVTVLNHCGTDFSEHLSECPVCYLSAPKDVAKESNIVHACFILKHYKFATPLCTVSMSVLESLFLICVVCVCVHWFLQRAYRNIFPLLRGAAALLSQSRSHAAHCICVLCVTSSVRSWIVSETMVCFALKGHLNHLPLGCKHRRIQRCCSETICIFPPMLSLECSKSPEST